MGTISKVKIRICGSGAHAAAIAGGHARCLAGAVFTPGTRSRQVRNVGGATQTGHAAHRPRRQETRCGPVALRAAAVKALERYDIGVIQVDFSESHKFAIASLHCATLELVCDQDER